MSLRGSPQPQPREAVYKLYFIRRTTANKKIPTINKFITAEEQRRSFEKLAEKMQAIGYSEDEEDLNDILKRSEIENRWGFMIQLLSEQALEKYGTIDITDEHMVELFREGLKEYRPVVNVGYLRKIQ